MIDPQRKGRPDPFLEALAQHRTVLHQRTEMARIERSEQKVRQADDPDLERARACLADHKSGLVNPRNSELWEHRMVN